MEEARMEMPVSSVSSETPKKDSMLGLKGLYEVFVNPGSLFAKIKESPRILVPYLVGFVFIFVFIWFISDLITRTQMEEIAKRAAENPNIPTNMNPNIIKWSTIIVGPIAWALGPLIAALLALFWGNFIMAGKATFKQLLSVMLFGEIVYLVGGLILVPLMLAKDSMFVSFSLAALVPPDPQSLLWLALSKVNLFLIWEIIVVGVGLSAIYSYPRNKGYWMSVLSMGMISIAHVLFTAIGKLF
jgi:hypothetical protein